MFKHLSKKVYLISETRPQVSKPLYKDAGKNPRWYNRCPKNVDYAVTFNRFSEKLVVYPKLGRPEKIRQLFCNIQKDVKKDNSLKFYSYINYCCSFILTFCTNVSQYVIFNIYIFPVVFL